MSDKENLKITFYNREDNEELSNQYSEFLMINRDGEVFELVHNGRGDYNPSYEGDWIDYKINGSSKTEEYKAKAKAFDVLYAEFDSGDKDLSLSKADFDEALEYESGETS